jgi:hypothetical protein
MSKKYINNFQSKALKNVPKLEFWFENKPSGNPGPNVTLSIEANSMYIHSFLGKQDQGQRGEAPLIIVIVIIYRQF